MSPFIIFITIVTLAYALYYAALITMDMAAKSKTNREQAETIPVDNADNETHDLGFRAKTVVEHTADGGFGIIDEAETEKYIAEKTPLVPAEEQGDDPAEPSVASEETSVEETETTQETASDSGVDEETPEKEETVEEEDDDPNIVSVDFPDEQPAAPEEPFDESQAFDPDLAQPEFGITHIVESIPDEGIQKLVDSINNELKPISVKSMLKSKQEMLQEINEKKSQTNIEHTDEVTQC